MGEQLPGLIGLAEFRINSDVATIAYAHEEGAKKIVRIFSLFAALRVLGC